MSSFLDKLFNREGKSAHQAKERLKFVLIHDRADISPGALQQMKEEIIQVISRHIEIEPEAVRIEMSSEGREQRLIADIPLKPPRRSRMG